MHERFRDKNGSQSAAGVEDCMGWAVPTGIFGEGKRYEVLQFIQ